MSHGLWPPHPILALTRQIHRTTNFTITITIATTLSPLPTSPPPYLPTQLSPSAVSQSHLLSLAALPFYSPDHDLLPNDENTESLPLSQIITLINSSAALESPHTALVPTALPTKATLDLGSQTSLQSSDFAVRQILVKSGLPVGWFSSGIVVFGVVAGTKPAVATKQLLYILRVFSPDKGHYTITVFNRWTLNLSKPNLG